MFISILGHGESPGNAARLLDEEWFSAEEYSRMNTFFEIKQAWI